ncbi:MAG TPA: FAD-dependent oxidoreductase, partial [Lacipirellulaceae bacterium]|nr:FAD-dependent oxidoreductase [Lacipirellulaceae bacterium]
HQIGVRESRRVYGEYRLTRDDCLEARQFNDTVLLCGAPIEDHRRAGAGDAETRWEYVRDNLAYGVPYRTLVPRGRDDIWVAGRCFSAPLDAHESCRRMGQTRSMGQAAGAAAVQSLREDCGARGITVATLQETLTGMGAVLEMPTEISDVAKDAWQIRSEATQS